jgi:hypothetical protein
VVYGRERGLSARRACTLFKVARSALSYRSRKAVKDAPVIKLMRSLSRNIRVTAIGAFASSWAARDRE